MTVALTVSFKLKSFKTFMVIDQQCSVALIGIADINNSN